MKKWLIAVVLMALAGAGLLSAQSGGVDILNHGGIVFTNTDCKKNNTCDLKKVEYFVEDYRVGIDGGYNYGTRFFARYNTDGTVNLEKFIFVQFIKGCNYTSRLVNGEVEVAYDRVYPRDAGAITFKFDDWTIDSYDFDPAYATNAGISRFYGYRWNIVPGSFSTKTEKYYGEQKPKNPELYIVDHPGQAFYLYELAHNISLKFRTCIYKTGEVPINASHENINFAEPISCFEWGSSFVFDHSADEFKSSSDIAPACQ